MCVASTASRVRAPSRSCTLAAVTTTNQTKPSVSTSTWRLRPLVLLPASHPCTPRGPWSSPQAVQGSQIISPAISGLLVQWLGANSCFLFDSFSFFFSAALVMSLTIQRQAATTAAKSMLQSLLHGFRFIFTHGAISFDIFAHRQPHLGAQGILHALPGAILPPSPPII
jgi:hypothetical protein